MRSRSDESVRIATLCVRFLTYLLVSFPDACIFKHSQMTLRVYIMTCCQFKFPVMFVFAFHVHTSIFSFIYLKIPLFRMHSGIFK